MEFTEEEESLESLWGQQQRGDDGEEEGEEEEGSGGRAVCAECGRPASICLCDYLPRAPLRTRGALVVRNKGGERGGGKLLSGSARSASQRTHRIFKGTKKKNIASFVLFCFVLFC